MKLNKFGTMILLAVACVSFSAPAHAARAKASNPCKKIVQVTSGGYIYKNSAPLRSGGPGTPLIGFRAEPTLIGVTKGLNRGGTTIYDSNNKKIGSCPWASAHDARGGRYRCTMNTAGLRKTAQRNTGSPKIRFTISGGTCVEVPHAGKCYGSNKGNCNRTY